MRRRAPVGPTTRQRPGGPHRLAVRPAWDETVGPARAVSLTRLQSPEECESGRIGTTGNRVLGNQPWVQIPPPPLADTFGLDATRPAPSKMGAYQGGTFSCWEGSRSNPLCRKRLPSPLAPARERQSGPGASSGAPPRCALRHGRGPSPRPRTRHQAHARRPPRRRGRHVPRARHGVGRHRPAEPPRPVGQRRAVAERPLRADGPVGPRPGRHRAAPCRQASARHHRTGPGAAERRRRAASSSPTRSSVSHRIGRSPRAVASTSPASRRWPTSPST